MHLKDIYDQVEWYTTVIPTLIRKRQGDHKFKGQWGYKEKPYQKAIYTLVTKPNLYTSYSFFCFSFKTNRNL